MQCCKFVCYTGKCHNHLTWRKDSSLSVCPSVCLWSVLRWLHFCVILASVCISGRFKRGHNAIFWFLSTEEFYRFISEDTVYLKLHMWYQLVVSLKEAPLLYIIRSRRSEVIMQCFGIQIRKSFTLLLDTCLYDIKLGLVIRWLHFCMILASVCISLQRHLMQWFSWFIHSNDTCIYQPVVSLKICRGLYL